MKKMYEKPRAYIQDMTLNCYVAGACTDANAIVLNYGEDSCSYTDPESYVTLFGPQCQDETGWGLNILDPNISSEYATLCYHRPLDMLNFFAS